MQSVNVKVEEDMGLSIQGDLTFDTLTSQFVQRVYEGISDLKAGNFQVELQNVKYADSAGLALLVQILRYARKKQKKVYFSHIPLQLMAIAKVSGIDKILPLK